MVEFSTRHTEGKDLYLIHENLPFELQKRQFLGLREFPDLKISFNKRLRELEHNPQMATLRPGSIWKK